MFFHGHRALLHIIYHADRRNGGVISIIISLLPIVRQFSRYIYDIGRDKSFPLFTPSFSDLFRKASLRAKCEIFHPTHLRRISADLPCESSSILIILAPDSAEPKNLRRPVSHFVRFLLCNVEKSWRISPDLISRIGFHFKVHDRIVQRSLLSLQRRVQTRYCAISNSQVRNDKMICLPRFLILPLIAAVISFLWLFSQSTQ